MDGAAIQEQWRDSEFFDENDCQVALVTLPALG